MSNVSDVPDEEPRADAVFDAMGQGCATLTPLIRLRLRELENGQVLEVRSDDPSAPEAMAAWCRLTGNTLIGALGDAACRRFFIRRK